MKYTIKEKISRYNDGIIDFVKTNEIGNIYIVSRGDYFKIRRVQSVTNGAWIWDLSRTSFRTLEDAEKALLSCDIDFNL